MYNLNSQSLVVTLLNDFCFALYKSFFSGLPFVCSFVLFYFSSDEMSFRLIFRFSHSGNPFLTPTWMAPALFFLRRFLFWMPLFYLLWSAKSRHLLNTTYLHSNDTVFHFRKQSIPYELENYSHVVGTAPPPMTNTFFNAFLFVLLKWIFRFPSLPCSIPFLTRIVYLKLLSIYSGTLCRREQTAIIILDLSSNNFHIKCHFHIFK